MPTSFPPLRISFLSLYPENASLCHLPRNPVQQHWPFLDPAGCVTVPTHGSISLYLPVSCVGGSPLLLIVGARYCVPGKPPLAPGFKEPALVGVSRRWQQDGTGSSTGSGTGSGTCDCGGRHIEVWKVGWLVGSCVKIGPAFFIYRAVVQTPRQDAFVVFVAL